jgi:ParB/Sulfiredoxin domain
MPTPAKLAKMGMPSSKVVKIRAEQIQPHPLAQRDPVKSNLHYLINHLDLDAIGVLHVVNYPINGKTGYWIIDGQHRWRALMEHGLGEWEVEVKIHLDVKDDARASALFLELNHRSPVCPYDKFLNELKAKHEDAIGMNDIALTHGCRISRQSADGCIAGITHMRKAYRLDGGKSLDKAVGTIIAAWGKRASGLEGKTIQGMSMVYARFNGVIDQASLAGKLAKYQGGPSALVGDARGLSDLKKSALTNCIAERIIDTYNKGRSSGKLDPL